MKCVSLTVIFTCVNVCKSIMWDASQIKIITVKRSKLTIKFYRSVDNLQEFVVIKVLFKAASGKLFPNFCSQLNMVWLILAKCSISGTRWGAESIHKNLKCLKTQGAQRASKVLLTLQEFFSSGAHPLPSLEFFLNNSGIPWWFCMKLCPREQNFLGNILA